MGLMNKSSGRSTPGVPTTIKESIEYQDRQRTNQQLSNVSDVFINPDGIATVKAGHEQLFKIGSDNAGGFSEGAFKVKPGRKTPLDSSLEGSGFGKVTGVAATNLQKEAPKPRSGTEIPIEGEAPGAAPSGELIYSGGRGYSDKQMMSGRVAISGLGAAGAGLRLNDFPASEIEGLDPDLLKKVLDLLRSAENKEKLKDYIGMVEDAQKAIDELSRQENPPPLMLAKAFYQKGWGLILQADTMQGLSNEERMAKYAEAEKALLESVRLNPKDPKAWEALSWAQLKLGKYEEAIASASQALALDPNMAKAYFIRAQAIKMLSQLNQARMLDDLKKCAALDPARCAKELKEAEEGMKFAPSAKTAGWLWTFLKALLGGAALLGVYGIFVGLTRLVKKIKARIAYARMSPEERRKLDLASAFSAESSNGRAQTTGELLAGKYSFSHVLSRSGPVELWAAKDKTSGQAVRIKKAFFEGPQDAMAKAIFLKEAKTLAGLRGDRSRASVRAGAPQRPAFELPDIGGRRGPLAGLRIELRAGAGGQWGRGLHPGARPGRARAQGL